MDNLSISHPSSARRKQNRSCLKDELCANLMRRTTQGARVVESLSIKGKTEGSLDARAECLSVTYTEKYHGRRQVKKHEGLLPRASTPELLILALMKAAESR